MEGIDVFDKIWIFVKILAQCKEGQEFRSLEVRGKLIKKQFAIHTFYKLHNHIEANPVKTFLYAVINGKVTSNLQDVLHVI